MASLSGCEALVVDTLVAVFKRLSNCQATGSSENEVFVVEEVLRNLLLLNQTLLSNVVEISSGETLVSDTGDRQNMSDVSGMYEDPTSSQPIENYGESDSNGGGYPGTKKMHQLEIIKVFVLIFVISIILLTTCRMVFQLFIRFRPEKPPIA